MGHSAKKIVANVGADQSVETSASVVLEGIVSCPPGTGNTGTLDSTFGGDGIVVYDSSTGDDVGKTMALDGAGNVYVAGFGNVVAFDLDLVICKYGSDGTLDSNFGGNGTVRYSIAPYTKGEAIALDDAGNIYVTGATGPDNASRNMIILKYSSDGTLDTTFDGDGIVVYDNSTDVNSSNLGEAIAVDSNRNVYVAGYRSGGKVIWKYGSNGTLDTTFDDNWVGVPSGHGYAIALEGTENVYVAGSSSSGDMVIWKYRSDGKPDRNFGVNGDGTVTHSIGLYNKGAAIALDDAGNIYVAGSSANSNYYVEGSSSDMVIWKYSSDGKPDSNFGSKGTVTHRIDPYTKGEAIALDDPYTKGEAIALDDAGNIYVTGCTASFNEGKTIKNMIILKYSSGGTLDTTFDDDGIVQYHVNSWNAGEAIALDSTGDVYVAGSSTNAEGENMVIWKYK
ncbi:MAG: hypothetical protein WBF77_13140 [Sulfurimonadaceae bacterium]